MAYGVDWPRGRDMGDLGEPPGFMDGDAASGGEGGGAGGQKEENRSETPLLGEDDEVDTREELSKATPPRSFGPASPLHVNPPRASTDNVHPKVTLNKVELTPTKKPAAAGLSLNRKPVEKKASIADGIPDVDELAKRFAALKR